MSTGPLTVFDLVVAGLVFVVATIVATLGG
jgi:hypothetical protein